MTERLLRATALSYVVSPAALAAWSLILARPIGSALADRGGGQAGARRGELMAGATKARAPRNPSRWTASRFASAADRAAFAEELAAAVTSLVGKYHDEAAPRGRDHRVIVAVHRA